LYVHNVISIDLLFVHCWRASGVQLFCH